MEEPNQKEEQYRIPKKITRRKFLSNTTLLVGGAAIYITGSGALFYHAALQNKKSGKTTRKPKNNLVLVGDKSKLDQLTEVTKVDYKTEIEDGWVTQNMEGVVYVTKDQNNELLIMSPVCTHLGCTVPFASKEEQQANPNVVFKCPCHGGEYDKWGRNIGGPPPRPLDVYIPIIQEDKVYFDYFSPKQRKK